MRRWLGIVLVALAACGGGAPAPVHLVMAATTSTVTAPPLTTSTAHPALPRASRSMAVQGRSPAAPARPPIAPRSTAGVEQWRALVSQYPWPVEEALRVMKCESGGRADAVGPRYVDRYGKSHWPMSLFQVMDGPADPAANVAVAYGMWARAGWGPWTCRP